VVRVAGNQFTFPLIYLSDPQNAYLTSNYATEHERKLIMQQVGENAVLVVLRLSCYSFASYSKCCPDKQLYHIYQGLDSENGQL